VPRWSAIPEAGLGHVHGRTVTEKDGSFRLGGLGAIAYDFVVEAPPPFVSRHIVRTEGGRTLEVTVVDGMRPVITVLDEDGSPVPHAAVLLKNRRKTVLETVRTNEQGIVRFGRIDTRARFTLEVRPQLRMIYARIEDWAPADTTVRLDRTYALSGTVRSKGGAPTSRAELYYNTAQDGIWRWVRVRPDGTYLIEGLRLPYLTLKVVPLGGDPEDTVYPVTYARAGPDEVDLLVP
jgi:hypothetical protein